MKNTREIIKEFTIDIKKLPIWVKNYLDGKRDLNRNISMYLEEYLSLPKGIIDLYDREHRKWLSEVI